MAIDLAQLVVSMEANTARFQKDMERVDKRLDRLSGTAKRFSRDFDTALKVFAGLGLGRAIRDVALFADSVGDSAKNAGLSTKAYQELRHAASQLDVEYGELDSALLKFNKTLGDARLGNKEAARSFEALGLDPAQFRNTDEAFAEVTKRLGMVEDGFARASLQSAIFGRAAGPKMAEFLSTSSGEVARLRNEAHELGLVMSDETIKAADEANKKFESLSTFIKTNLAASFANLTPIIAAATKALFDFMNAPKPLSSEELESQREELNRLTRLRNDIEDGGSLYGPSGENVLDELGARNKDEALRILGQRIRGQQELIQMTQRMMNAPKAAPASSETIDPAAALRGAALDKERVAAEKLLETYGSLDPELRKLTEAQDQANQLLTKKKLTAEEYTATIEGIEKAYGDLGAVETEDAMSIFADQAARNIQSFTASLVDAAMAGDNMADTIVAALRRIAAEMLTSMLLQSLGDSLSGSSNPFLAGLGKGLAGARAEGGPVAGGSAYLVGEEGPELFVPRTSGNIVPNGGFGGRGRVEINVDARGADPASAANMMRALADVERRIYENFQRGMATVPA